MAGNIFVSIRNITRKRSISLTRINNERLFNKAGFSLLEFTIALVIIAALVSVLIPKLNELQDNAHKSNVQLTANSLQSAVNLAHNLWQSQGSMNKTALLKGYGEGNILMGGKGWPVSALSMNEDDSIENITRLALNSSTCKRLWNGLLKNTSPKVNAVSDSKRDELGELKFIYLTEFNQGVCSYHYLLTNNGWRIEYDLGTGRVITLF
tara:strand:+ start:3307 stop:3933 length:627 start_codon:yes stop_codon:yes gene_type:complete